MKYLFVFITLVIGVNSMAQSKKEQIAILTIRLDSLNKEYIKDTTYLSNTVETIDREYSILSMQNDEAQDVIKKKSATISEKTNTIKSLNKKNMELMEELKEMRISINTLQLENKRIKQSLDSLTALGKDTGDTETDKQPSCDEIKGFIYTYTGGPADLDLIPKDYTGIVFSCTDDKVRSLTNYKDGKLDGLARMWYENGQLWSKQNFKGGGNVGLARSWHWGGQLCYEWNYKDGKLDGLWRRWYENGQLFEEYNYKDGLIISEKCWYEDGTPRICK